MSWSFDFTAACKTSGSGLAYTLDARGNTVADAALTIDQTVGVRVEIDNPSEFGSVGAVLVKYRNLQAPASGAHTLMALRDSLGNVIGVRMAAEESTCLTGYYEADGTRSYPLSNNPTPPESGYILMSYSATQGIAVHCGESLDSLSGGANGELHWSDTLIRGFNIGGPESSAAYPAWEGMVIEGIAIFKDLYCTDDTVTDFADFKFPDFVCISGAKIGFRGVSTNWVDGEFVLKYDNPSAASELILPTAVDAWVLAVGGGGAGANPGSVGTTVGGAGGGGAGGFVENEILRMDAGTYAITVGAGGTPENASESIGKNGLPTYIQLNGGAVMLSAEGGGGGGIRSVGNGGGSGGGGSKANGGAGTSGQGYNGGNGGSYSQAGAGGGGAGGAGKNVSKASAGSDGGDGKASSITGELVYYAGGGGGGSRAQSATASVGGAGGSGIGGHGAYGTSSSKTSATAGLDGTGSGGGGGCYNQAGGAGGSGVVIIRIRNVMPLKPAPDVLTWLYDGQEHAPVDVSDESHVKVQEGTAAASDAGTYELTVAPAAGCVWSDGTTGPVTLTWEISKRAVTLTSADDSWTYDGQAHSNTTVTVGGDGFAAGEGLATTSGWATITDVGTNDNTFAYTLLANTRADNYDISVTTGRISVVAAPVTWPLEWPQDADDGVKAKFDAWKDTYGVTAFAGAEDAFLMNADPDVTVPALRIEGIVVSDGIATVVVGAEGVDLEKDINGKLYVDASDDLVNWTTTEIDLPLPGGFSGGKATFEVESGKFMRAKVGIKVPVVE